MRLIMMTSTMMMSKRNTIGTMTATINSSVDKPEASSFSLAVNIKSIHEGEREMKRFFVMVKHWL